MLGFIKKDLLMIKGNLKSLVILFFIYSVMVFQGQIDSSFMLVYLSVILMMSTFSYDTYNKWDAYSITFPNGRKNNVRAKYCSTIILIVITAIIVTILSMTISYVSTNAIDFENIIGNLVGCTFATSLLVSFMYPPIYKFGLEKARIGIFLVIFGVSFAAGLIAKYVDFSSVIKMLDFIGDYLIVILPIAAILILYISYKISERIYFKKEM